MIDRAVGFINLEQGEGEGDHGLPALGRSFHAT